MERAVLGKRRRTGWFRSEPLAPSTPPCGPDFAISNGTPVTSESASRTRPSKPEGPESFRPLSQISSCDPEAAGAVLRLVGLIDNPVCRKGWRVTFDVLRFGRVVSAAVGASAADGKRHGTSGYPYTPISRAGDRGGILSCQVVRFFRATPQKRSGCFPANHHRKVASKANSCRTDDPAAAAQAG